jgi:hypothetical protein
MASDVTFGAIRQVSVKVLNFLWHIDFHLELDIFIGVNLGLAIGDHLLRLPHFLHLSQADFDERLKPIHRRLQSLPFVENLFS